MSQARYATLRTVGISRGSWFGVWWQFCNAGCYEINVVRFEIQDEIMPLIFLTLAVSCYSLLSLK
jgi:hypothetical protein